MVVVVILVDLEEEAVTSRCDRGCSWLVVQERKFTEVVTRLILLNLLELSHIVQLCVLFIDLSSEFHNDFELL